MAIENLEFKELDFDNIAIDKINNIAIHIETGEIYDSKSTTQIIYMLDEKKKKDKILKAKEKELKEIIGIEDKKDTFQFNWKENSNFIKVYRTEKREYFKTIKMSASSGLVISYIMDYIEYETNRIAKTEKSTFTNKELEELTGLSDKTLKNALNELEELLIIARTGQRQSREIYFNPYLACSGNEILKTTIELFKDYRPITAY